MSDLSNQIETAAGKAKRLKSGNNEREAHSLKEMIEADRHLQNGSANTESNRRGLIITKFRPPGST